MERRQFLKAFSAPLVVGTAQADSNHLRLTYDGECPATVFVPKPWDPSEFYGLLPELEAGFTMMGEVVKLKCFPATRSWGEFSLVIHDGKHSLHRWRPALPETHHDVRLVRSGELRVGQIIEVTLLSRANI